VLSSRIGRSDDVPPKAILAEAIGIRSAKSLESDSNGGDNAAYRFGTSSMILFVDDDPTQARWMPFRALPSLVTIVVGGRHR